MILHYYLIIWSKLYLYRFTNTLMDSAIKDLLFLIEVLITNSLTDKISLIISIILSTIYSLL